MITSISSLQCAKSSWRDRDDSGTTMKHKILRSYNKRQTKQKKKSELNTKKKALPFRRTALTIEAKQLVP